MDFSIEPLAEDALLLRFGEGIDLDVNARVHAATRALRAATLPGIVDIAPAYATLLLRFEPFAWSDDGSAGPFERLTTALRTSLLPADSEAPDDSSRQRLPPGDGEQRTGSRSSRGVRFIEIPVCYGGECGPDLDTVAEHAHLAPDETIARHAIAEYTVAMLGFAPGFPYLLGLDPALHVPRRAHPRTRVPAGSVAIGGAQTGIYPRELPGGWHLIGRTPLALFDPERDPPCLLAPGDRVRFRAIASDEFMQLAERGG
jgi:KipI family sensor histidine kinase inhibitor